MRQLLREAIDRRRRELLNTVDADQVAADRALFADDGVTVSAPPMISEPLASEALRLRVLLLLAASNGKGER
jgi:hypothetical protein